MKYEASLAFLFVLGMRKNMILKQSIKDSDLNKSEVSLSHLSVLVCYQSNYCIVILGAIYSVLLLHHPQHIILTPKIKGGLLAHLYSSLQER